MLHSCVFDNINLASCRIFQLLPGVQGTACYCGSQRPLPFLFQQIYIQIPPGHFSLNEEYRANYWHNTLLLAGKHLEIYQHPQATIWKYHLITLLIVQISFAREFRGRTMHYILVGEVRSPSCYHSFPFILSPFFHYLCEPETAACIPSNCASLQRGLPFDFFPGALDQRIGFLISVVTLCKKKVYKR